MNIKPLADRVLIEPAPAEERTIGGIIIPDTAKEKPLKGEVVAVGNGTKDEDMIVKVGDTVTIFGEDPTIVELADILGTIPYEVLTSVPRRIERIIVK